MQDENQQSNEANTGPHEAAAVAVAAAVGAVTIVAGVVTTRKVARS